ncbi:MAG UNVERIFIED_CONTAM: hypothetical protein LVR29_12730 [Microcystis novacekii LVE1205-3]
MIIISLVSVSLKIMLVNIISHNFLLKSVDKMTLMIFKIEYQFLAISFFSYQLSGVRRQNSGVSRQLFLPSPHLPTTHS